MTMIYEKQFWCDDCQRSHTIKLHSIGEADDDDKARLFPDGNYADQLRKHTVCASCGGNIIPHTNLDIVSIKGEWKDLCPECVRTP